MASSDWRRVTWGHETRRFHTSRTREWRGVSRSFFFSFPGGQAWAARSGPVNGKKFEPTHAPITPNFPSGSSREIVGDYVEK